MCVLIFSSTLESLGIVREIQRDVIRNVHRSSYTVHVIIVRF